MAILSVGLRQKKQWQWLMALLAVSDWRWRHTVQS
jgi:hypothetical protein